MDAERDCCSKCGRKFGEGNIKRDVYIKGICNICVCIMRLKRQMEKATRSELKMEQS